MSISESMNYDILGAIFTLSQILTRPYETGIFTFPWQMRKQTTLVAGPKSNSYYKIARLGFKSRPT